MAGVACLGTPAELGPLVARPRGLRRRHCRRTGVITTPGFPDSLEAWAKELSVLHPTEDAALLKGRPILLVHGSEDPDVPVRGACGPWPKRPPVPPSSTWCSAPGTGCGPTRGRSPSWWAGSSGVTSPLHHRPLNAGTTKPPHQRQLQPRPRTATQSPPPVRRRRSGVRGSTAAHGRPSDSAPSGETEQGRLPAQRRGNNATDQEDPG